MAVDIGTLVANITADADDFNNAVDDVDDGSTRMFDGMRSVEVMAGQLAATIAIQLVGTLRSLASEQFATADASAKFARELDISRSALEGLRFSADLMTRQGATALDRALQDMIRRVAEAEEGMGTASRAFETLGLEAEEVAAMGVDDMFFTIADAIAAQESPALQARLAYEALGRQGMELLEMLRLGSDGIREQIQELDNLRGGIDEVNTDAIESLNDEITRVTQRFVGWAEAMAAQAAPALERMLGLVDVLVDVVRVADDIVGGNLMTIVAWSAAFLASIGAIRAVIAILALLRAQLIAIIAAQITKLALLGPAGWAVIAAGAAIATGAIVAFRSEIEGIAESSQDLTEEFAEIDDQMNQLIDSTQIGSRSLGGLGDSVRRTLNELERKNRELQKSERELLAWQLRIDGAAEETREYALALFDANRELEEMEEMHRRAERALDRLKSPVERIQEEIREYERWLEEGIITQEEFNRLMEDAEERLEEARDRMEEAADEAENFERALRRVADAAVVPDLDRLALGQEDEDATLRQLLDRELEVDPPDDLPMMRDDASPSERPMTVEQGEQLIALLGRIEQEQQDGTIL